MADAIVRGEIEGLNDAEFRATVSCLRTGPFGSISGEIDVTIARREIEYSFRSSRPTRIIATRSGISRYVYVVFRNAVVTNLRSHFATTGATIILSARRSSTGRYTATLTIRRPGRRTLSASGILEGGTISVFREVSCRR